MSTIILWLNKAFKLNYKGFTLIELLVSITIIAILASAGSMVYSGAQKSARIAKRREDLVALQKALEIYKLSTGTYPPNVISSCITSVSSVQSALVPKYMKSLPTDPLGGSNCYYYLTDSKGTGYKVYNYNSEMNTSEYNTSTSLIDPARDGNPNTCEIEPATVNAWAVYSGEDSCIWQTDPTATASPAGSPSPSSPPASPAPTTPPATATPTAAPYYVYNDSLASGFSYGGWDYASIDPNSTSAPYSGTKNLTWTTNANGWGGLQLTTTSPVNPANYSNITFAIKSSGSYDVKVYFRFATSPATYSPNFYLSSLGGNATTTYKLYTIPISSLNASGNTINQVNFQANTSSGNLTFYIDQVRFEGGSGSASSGPFNKSANCYGLSIPNYPEVRPYWPSQQGTSNDNTSYNYVGPIYPDLSLTPDTDKYKAYLMELDGNCTGTTEQILEWAARKWGFGKEIGVMDGKTVLGKTYSQPSLFSLTGVDYSDIAKAEAVIETWWRQSYVNYNQCGWIDPNNQSLGYRVDPSCATYSINQVACLSWGQCEKARISTAFAADYAMSVARFHFDGNSWLGTGTQGDIRNAIAAWECGCGNFGYNDRYGNRVFGGGSYTGSLNDKLWKTPGVAPHWF